MKVQRLAGSQNQTSLLYLTTIVVIGSILRLFHLGVGHGPWKFRNDEPFTQNLVELPWGELISTTAQDVHPPLYYLLLKLWSLVFGSHLTSLRAFSVLFGVAAIPLTFVVGRKLFTERTGLIAAAFMSVSWFLIFKAQDARMYTLIVVFALVSMYGFLRVIEDPNDYSGIAILIFGTVGFAYTHIYFVFLSIGQAAYIGYLYSTENTGLAVMKGWGAAKLASAVLFLPWVPVIFSQLSGDGSISQSPNGLITLAHTYVGYFAGSVPLTLIFTSVLIYGGWLLTRDRLERDHTVFLILWGVSTVLILYLVSFWLAPIRYSHRYAIAGMPAFYILTAACITKTEKKWSQIAVVGSIIAFSLHRVLVYFDLTTGFVIGA